MTTPLLDRRESRHRATRSAAKVIRRCFQPPVKMDLVEWSDTYRYLSPEANSLAVEAGQPVRYSSALTPYHRRPMQALSDPRVQKVVLMWPSQVGKTELGTSFIGMRIHLEPGPMLVIQPTLQMAEAWSKDRLAPMLRDTPVLRGKVKDARSRDSGNTLLHKSFAGGHITISGANSPAGLASRPIRDVIVDEVDRFPLSAGTEGDPIGLAFRRTVTFRNGKKLLISSPTIKGESRIEAEFEDGTRERLHLPCPHCGTLQILRFGSKNTPWGLKWEPGRPETAHYVCAHCACVIEESWKPWMLERCRWIAENPDHPTTVSLWMNALASPFPGSNWESIVREFLRVKGDPLQLQQWVNTVLCETYEQVTQKIDVTALEQRAETWADSQGNRVEVPMGVGLLTAFVDVQGDRVEMLIRGWGANEESWMIAHHRIYGDVTVDPTVFQRVEALRLREYRHEGGARMRILAMGIDSGDGKRVNEVYDYVRPRQREGVYATKGQPARQREPVRRATRPDKNGIRRVDIGTHPMKVTLFSRLAMTLEEGRPPPPGYMHFRARDPDWHNGADAEFYAQFGREKPVRRQLRNGRWVVEWVATGANESIDLEVGNLSMLHVLGPQVREDLGSWVAKVIEEGKLERERERSEGVAAEEEARPRRRSSWIHGW